MRSKVLVSLGLVGSLALGMMSPAQANQGGMASNGNRPGNASVANQGGMASNGNRPGNASVANQGVPSGDSEVVRRPPADAPDGISWALNREEPGNGAEGRREFQCTALDLIAAIVGAETNGVGNCKNLVALFKATSEILTQRQERQKENGNNGNNGGNSDLQEQFAQLREEVREFIAGQQGKGGKSADPTKSSQGTYATPPDNTKVDSLMRGAQPPSGGQGQAPSGGAPSGQPSSGGFNPAELASAALPFLQQALGGLGNGWNPVQAYQQHLAGVNATAREAVMDNLRKIETAAGRIATEGNAASKAAADEGQKVAKEHLGKAKELAGKAPQQAQNELEALLELIKLVDAGNNISYEGFSGLGALIGAGTQVDAVGHATTAGLLNQVVEAQRATANAQALNYSIMQRQNEQGNHVLNRAVGGGDQKSTWAAFTRPLN